MGKVLAEALAAPIVLLLLGFGVLRTVRYFRGLDHKEKAQQHGWAVEGDLNRDQETMILNQLEQAERLLKDMISPVDRDSWDDATILATRHRSAITSWLDTNDYINNKLRKR